MRASETIQDDLYAAGQTVQVLGTIDGDLVVAADQVSVTGTVNGDLIVLGGSVAISGPVYGVVRVLGGHVSLDSHVEFDALLAGGEVRVGPGAHVGRDALLAFGEAEVAGRVDRHVRAWTERLSIGGTTNIGGDVVYSGGERMVRDPKAIVRGQARQVAGNEAPPAPAARLLDRTTSWIKLFVGLAAFGLLFVGLLPGAARETAQTVSESPWGSLGLGMALMLLVPLVTAACTLAGIVAGGWWIGVAALAAWLIALPVAYVAASLRLGLWITGRFDGRWSGSGWSLLAGLVSLELLACAPYAGWIVRGAALCFGLGALGLVSARAVRRNRTAMKLAPRASGTLVRAPRTPAPRVITPLPERKASTAT